MLSFDPFESAAACDSWDTWDDAAADTAWTTTEALAEQLNVATIRLDRAIRTGLDPVNLRRLATEVRGLARAVLASVQDTTTATTNPGANR